MKRYTVYISTFLMLSSLLNIPLPVLASAGTWIKKADMPTARSEVSTSVVNGKVYAIGGWRGGGIELSTVEEYGPVADKWAKKADMPTARQFFSTNVVNGKVYAIGGWRRGTALSTVEEYNPVKDEWTKKADMPGAVFGLSTSAVNGKIYAIGGRRGVEAQGKLATTWGRRAGKQERH